MTDPAPRWSHRARQAWRSTDAVVVAVLAVAGVVYALHGFHGMLTRDLALYTYAGQQVADGVPPYVGVLNRAGPLAHALPAVGVVVARVVGGDDVIATRVFFLVLAAASTAAVYLLARDALKQRAAGLLAAATFLGFHGFIRLASDGPREKTPMTLFLVLAAWAVTRRWWFTAGVLVGLTSLCLQIAFLPAFAVAVVGILVLARGLRGRLVALLRLVLGGAAPVALCVVWFALAGSLGQSLEGFVLINARYTVPDPPWGRLDVVASDAVAAYGVVGITLLLVGTVVLVLGAAGTAVPSVRRRLPWLLPLVPLAAGALAGLAWDLRDYDAWPDLFPLLPFAAVGVAVLLPLAQEVAQRLPQQAAQHRGAHDARWVRPVVAVAVAAALAGSLQWSLTHHSNDLDVQRADVRAVFAELPRDATLTSIEAPTPLVLTRRTNPTRHQMFQSGLQHYVDDTWPGGLAGFVQDLLAREPTLIALGERSRVFWRHAIRPDYTCVGTAPGFSWWARRDLGRGTIDAVRDVAHYTSSRSCARQVG